MKKIIIILCFMIMMLTLSGCIKSGLNLSDYLKAIINKKEEGSIAVKVNGNEISIQKIREEMRYSLGYEYSENNVEEMMANELLQKNYEEKIIRQYLIITKVLEDEIYKSEDFQKYLEIQIKETIVKYYLYKNFFEVPENKEWKTIMKTTDREILDFYEENKDFFDKKGVKKEDALYAIKTDIEKRKSDLFLLELTKFQKKLINDLKEEYKVEKINN